MVWRGHRDEQDKETSLEELMSQQGGGPATAGLFYTEDRGLTALTSRELIAVQDLLNESFHFSQSPG